MTPALRVKQGISQAAHRLGLGRRPGARVLSYHSIVPEAAHDPGQMTTPVRLFEAQMAWLAEHGYRVEPAAALIERLRCGQAAPAKTVALTFDDGFADNELALPALAWHGFSATMFLVAAAVEGRTGQVANGYPAAYLSRAQLLAMQRTGLVQFGCHGATHRCVRGMAAGELEAETAGARRRMQEALEAPVDLFAYPFGSFGAWDAAARSAVARAGFTGAFTSVMGANAPSQDPWLLRRCRVSWANDLPSFERLLQGAYDWYAAVQWAQSLRQRRVDAPVPQLEQPVEAAA